MQTIILCGGLGTRLREETEFRPKPMVEIGGKPILWHIMKIYSSHGINEFIICCGYKGHVIKEYFSNYFIQWSDITFDLKNNKTIVHQTNTEPWKVTLVNTGENTMTGGRLKRVKDFIGDETFCFTYGDGVSDINITELIKFHSDQKTIATMTAVLPVGRFGAINIDSNQNKITSFKEKPRGDGAWINGGFFILEPSVIDYISEDATVWEQEPLMKLSHEGMLSAFKHSGFWQPMDTLRDKMYLEDLWKSGKAPWKKW